jgi:hypothetical protein
MANPPVMNALIQPAVGDEIEGLRWDDNEQDAFANQRKIIDSYRELWISQIYSSMDGSSMWRSKTGGTIPKPNAHVPEPHDIASNSVLDKQHPDLMVLIQTLLIQYMYKN